MTQQPFSTTHLNWREEIGMTEEEADRLIAIGARNRDAWILRGQELARQRREAAHG